jgi:hypothetical protein
MNEGTWKIFDRNKLVEICKSPKQAQEAMLILSAHEIKNGRVANFRISPPVNLEPDITKLNLPEWALEVLKKEGL